MKIRVIIGFLVFGVLSMLLCETVLRETISYEKALQLSQEDDKLILLKLESNDCKYCVQMNQEVFTNHEVQALLENFRVVQVNVDREKIPLDLELMLSPTFVFVNKEEEIVKKLPGAWTTEDFIEFLNDEL